MHNRMFKHALLIISVFTWTALAQAQTLRLLTWKGYAPTALVERFQARYPDIKVEVSYSNNEDMIAQLRAKEGAGYDLVQPSHDRIYSAHTHYNIYKPLDLSQINLDALEVPLLAGVRENTTINGFNFAVPHIWGTSGLVVNTALAPKLNDWADLCNSHYLGRTSMRLSRTILLGMAFSMGENPFDAYADPDHYQDLLNRVTEKLIDCRENIFAYWNDAQALSEMMRSGDVVAAETWDSTAFKLSRASKEIEFIPPATGALAWIDTFALPRLGRADDAAYKWINFVYEPQSVRLISKSSGSISAVRGGVNALPSEQKIVVSKAFTADVVANLKFFANIPPGIEAMESKAIERIKALSLER